VCSCRRRDPRAFELPAPVDPVRPTAHVRHEGFMSSFFTRRGALLALAVGSAAAAAQPQRPAAPDPLDASASAPSASHRSAFKEYHRFDDAPAVRWRDANDTVDRIGGWRSYAREAQSPATSPAAAPAAASAPHTPAPKPATGQHGHRH
jgi:hypothetical protein